MRVIYRIYFSRAGGDTLERVEGTISRVMSVIEETREKLPDVKRVVVVRTEEFVVLEKDLA